MFPSTQTEENLDHFTLLNQFPLSGFTSVVAIIMVIMFFVSSADSNTFVLSSLSSHGSLRPTATPILSWGILTGACAIVLLIAGGLVALQQAAMLSALPFTIIVMILAVSLFKELRHDRQIVQEIANARKLGL
ncbi:BCCT family transporter [Micrococcoides hystricis]|uniref:BCCT family transporter n=1 Tax=Micrococcoides hystricis TaxID=1572761 RepID=A0ABV6P938_9MICC